VTEKRKQKQLPRKGYKCFRHNKMGHYSNECEEELPKMTAEKKEAYDKSYEDNDMFSEDNYEGLCLYKM